MARPRGECRYYSARQRFCATSHISPDPDTTDGSQCRFCLAGIAAFAAVAIALLLIFLLGVFLGSIAGVSWLRSGIQTLLVAILTAALIYLFAGY